MRLLEPTAQIWMKIDSYYQRQKCRPMNLVSENIRFMRIFAGFPLGAGVKRHWGLLTTAIFGYLAGYVFENVRDTASNIIWHYATPCRPANECKMNDLEWPWVAISWQNAFLASTSRIKTFWMSEIVQPRRFCGVLCISRSTCTYTYTYCRETARQLRIHAQLTRCFSAVAELLVGVVVERIGE